jgi:hypothetical protein
MDTKVDCNVSLTWYVVFLFRDLPSSSGTIPSSWGGEKLMSGRIMLIWCAAERGRCCARRAWTRGPGGAGRRSWVGVGRLWTWRCGRLPGSAAGWRNQIVGGGGGAARSDLWWPHGPGASWRSPGRGAMRFWLRGRQMASAIDRSDGEAAESPGGEAAGGRRWSTWWSLGGGEATPRPRCIWARSAWARKRIVQIVIWF